MIFKIFPLVLRPNFLVDVFSENRKDSFRQADTRESGVFHTKMGVYRGTDTPTLATTIEFCLVVVVTQTLTIKFMTLRAVNTVRTTSHEDIISFLNTNFMSYSKSQIILIV